MQLSHAYIPSILKFDSKSYIESESFTEYMAILVMAYYTPEIYDKIIMRNRLDLINLELANQTNKNIYKYLYGVNLLHAAFSDNKDQYFDFINMLIQKYAYTEIGINEIQQTAHEIHDLTNSNSIDADSLLLWSDCRLYNIDMSYTNIYEANMAKKGRMEKKRLVSLSHNFPVPMDVTLIAQYRDHADTNLVKMDKESFTNLVLDTNIISLEAVTGRDGILERESGRHIDFNNSNNTGQMLIDSLNNYYGNQKITNKLVKISREGGQFGNFNVLSDDRERSHALSPEVRFQFDSMYQGADDLYIQAFKLIGGKLYSYVLFQVKKDGNKYMITGVKDPSL